MGFASGVNRMRGFRRLGTIARVLVKHGFDPDRDLIKNEWGVNELSGNKPGLRQDIDRYFRQRHEDGNVMDI